MGYTNAAGCRFVVFPYPPFTFFGEIILSSSGSKSHSLMSPKHFVTAALMSLVLTPDPSHGQQSAFLQNPDLFVGFVQESADFWRGVHDSVNGGFFTNVSREGQLITAWGTNKDVLTQSRNLYAMVRAFQLTGDESFLDLAESAFGFMTAHGWDETNGGWFSGLSSGGSVLNANAFKTAFIQHYAMLGPLAYAEATDDSTAWRWVDRTMDYLNDVFWDGSASRKGYFDRVNRTGSFRTGKSFNATVDALTTHAIALWMLRGDDVYRIRLEELTDNIIDRLLESMDSQAIGFAEKYDSNWLALVDERMTIMGHVLKTAWVLGRMHAILPDARRLEAARALADHVLEKGYDHQFGGLYKDYDRTTGTMQLYGLPDSTKAWWQMEQAFTAGLELYRLTDDPSYLDMADETISFFMDHFVDPVYGEVYADRTRRGDGIPQWGDHKGNGYKAAYHSVETGWYGYLYGHLALARTPATIHYRFDASDAERVVTLAPLENDTSMGEGYAIYSVSYSGMPWTSFDAATNTLIIPPSVEGVFTVVFDQANVVAVEQPSDQTRTLEVWPNPTRDHISIRLGDAFTGSAHLTRSIQWYLIDALGRTVQRGDMTHLSSTSPTWHLETNFLASGVYTLLVTDTVQRVSKRVVILK